MKLKRNQFIAYKKGTTIKYAQIVRVYFTGKKVWYDVKWESSDTSNPRASFNDNYLQMLIQHDYVVVIKDEKELLKYKLKGF
jgi:hypothetical protein